MASSPSNMSPWPGVKEPLPFPAPITVEPEPKHLSDSELVFTRLREQIAAGTQEPDILLGAIAIAAQAMTDATGAALGVRRDGSVACVGRSGETAPALGARLSENSGISGECLRTGRSQRCDDTDNDPRVDAEVCRHLGLRSIAAVPIRSRLETVGILEVFSTSSHAFTEEHLNCLASLAEMADVVSSPKLANNDPQPETLASPAEPLPRPDLPILASPWMQPGKSRKQLWWYLAGTGAALVLALFLFASWRMLNEIRSRNSTQAITQTPATAPANNEIATLATSNLSAKPTPEQITSTQPASKNSPKSRGIVPAADIEAEPDDGLIRSIPVDSPAVSKTQNTANSTKSAEAEVSAPPQVSMVNSNENPLGSVLATTASLPQLEKQESQGAIPVVLERRIMPLYPREALTLRREGAVVIHATVSDKGRVSQLKVVSGDAILGRAALDAVRQWHYRPALLNGKPAASETDITLNFKLP